MSIRMKQTPAGIIPWAQVRFNQVRSLFYYIYIYIYFSKEYTYFLLASKYKLCTPTWQHCCIILSWLSIISHTLTHTNSCIAHTHYTHIHSHLLFIAQMWKELLNYNYKFTHTLIHPHTHSMQLANQLTLRVNFVLVF